jgi:thiamine biosynthesis lipoprotein
MKAFRDNAKFYRILLLLLIVWTLPFHTLSCRPINPSERELPSSQNPEYLSKSDFLLNTVVSISLYDKQEEALIDASFDLIENYESIFSRTMDTSELYKLSHGLAPKIPGKSLTYSLSEELSDILRYAFDYSKLTDGAFDLTIAPISSIWDFKSQEPSIPEDTKLKQALPLVDYKNIQLSGNEIAFAKEGIEIDLGAIAKGYIADKVKEYLMNNGVKSAIINLGGNLLCVGDKPDHTPFYIGIQKPYADRNETIATMEISDQSVVSSGVYERFFELDGKFYHHILNPTTGYPYDNGLISVTIISPKSVDGDGLSTSCFALGLEKGLQLIERLPDTYAVFITEDYELHYSSGFEAAIHIRSK